MFKLFTILFFTSIVTIHANSQGITNYGNVHNFAGGNMATSLPFVNNAAAGTDYVNDGNFYTTSHFENNKAAMPAGTGNIYFNGTALQNISGTNTAQFYNVIIDNNAAGLQPSSIGFTFNVAGNWINNGVFNHNKGTVVFNGSTAKNIGGTAAKTIFYNFNLSNPTTLSLQHNVDLINAFSFKTVSNATLASAGFLTVKSADSVTAQIADITDNNTLSGNIITGDVTIERYLFPRLAWRFLATPIAIAATPTISQSWRENNSSIAVSTGYGTRITGPGAIGVNGVDAYTQRGSLKYYNDANNTFTEIAATNGGIANAQGYFVFVRGDRSVAVGSAASSTTLRMKGNIRMNNQTFTVLPNSFHSFGNPYASRIDFRTVSKPTTVDAFTIWDPNNVGLYNVGGYENYVNIAGNYWLNGITTGAGAKMRNNIESGEAAFIQSITGGTITVHEADKAAGSAMVSRGESENDLTIPTLDITLFAKNNVADSFALVDGVSVNFDNSYSNNIDNNDAKKIINTFDNLSIKKINNNSVTNLVVERRALPTATDTIQLNLSGTRVGNYTFKTYASLLGSANVDAFLVDKFLQTSTALSLVNENSFPFSITADAASKAVDRFMIVFKQAVVLPVQFIHIAAIKNIDKTHTVKWTIANEYNIQQYQIERSNNGNNFTSIGTTDVVSNNGNHATYQFIDTAPFTEKNYYRIKAIDISGTIQYSAIVPLHTDAKQSAISVTPNPVANKCINIQFTNKVGNYTLTLLGADGKTIQTTQAIIKNKNEVKTWIVNNIIASGNYVLQISNANIKEQIKIVIQ
jgi:hypothetical protein